MEGTLLTAAQRSEMEALVARYTATSDIADGIKNTEQSSKFIDLMREQSIVPKIAQLYKMESNTRDINAIGLAPDQLRKKTEGIAPETWVDIAVSKNTLTGVMCIYPIAITYESLLRNIEKQELEGTIDAQSAKTSRSAPGWRIVSGGTAPSSRLPLWPPASGPISSSRGWTLSPRCT